MSGWMVGLILLVSAVELMLAGLILRRVAAAASVADDLLKEVEK